MKRELRPRLFITIVCSWWQCRATRTQSHFATVQIIFILVCLCVKCDEGVCVWHHILLEAIFFFSLIKRFVHSMKLQLRKGKYIWFCLITATGTRCQHGNTTDRHLFESIAFLANNFVPFSWFTIKFFIRDFSTWSSISSMAEKGQRGQRPQCSCQLPYLMINSIKIYTDRLFNVKSMNENGSIRRHRPFTSTLNEAIQ